MKVTYQSTVQRRKDGTYNPPSAAIIIEHGIEFAHHGIKGQKWGVRRYQNPDGTYTAAGKKRYLKDLNASAKKLKADDKKSVSDHVNNFIEDSDRDEITKLSDKVNEATKKWNTKDTFENSSDYKKFESDVDRKTMESIKEYDQNLYKQLKSVPVEKRYSNKDYEHLYDEFHAEGFDTAEKAFAKKNPNNSSVAYDRAFNKLYDKVEETSRKLSVTNDYNIKIAIIDDIFEKLNKRRNSK